MKKKLFLGAAIIGLSSSAFAALTVPLSVTSGFDVDIVADSITAPYGSSGSVDRNGFVFVADPLAANPLPADGVIAVGSNEYQAANYTGNNAMQVIPGDSETLSVSGAVVPTNQIGVLYSAGNGPVAGSVTLNFSDTTSQLITGLSYLDWWTGGPTAYTRLQTSNGTMGQAYTPREMLLTLDAGNVGKTLVSLEFANTSATGNPTLNVMAVSVAVPEPSTYAALFGLCALGLAVYRRRR